ncbi:transcription initiation factor IIB [candidate division MSBL1 archaeon SCGC-AAA259I09]|uniref:Transcription initiation factor IIB n=3 Tax=candidate division MSBL1 TaxID=215777 RepID=A0A133UR56_9EURY|nr:transcription initiation factor IIB [candidate division MSBL1 archaeon SCGC-AAA259E22]KXA96629.1 transcription initiation factor IIB [candidate division MSBL1 archaeon SCGC-AAA259I09]KXA98759.1 transcription initiation factor IIB [candidate division MSBL1 archaeon SCGC-AAA259M10]
MLFNGVKIAKAKESSDINKECPTCDNSPVVRDYQRNITICGKCGRILKEGIKDRGPEWRAFDQEQREERSRGGAPMTYTIHDKGLSTKIDWKNRDGRGQSLSPQKRSRMYRLRKWQRRIRVSDATERNLAFALSEMDRMSSQLGLPRNIREIAAMIYRDAVKNQLIRGRSIEGVSSAALYAGCRETQMPRTLEEIAEVSRVDKKEIGRSYRFITRELDIHLPPTDPANYVSRFGSQLEVSGEVRTEAMGIIKKAQEEKLTSGRGPTGIAAAALYVATLKKGERRTQREIAEVAQVTEVTVRNRYKELAEELDLEINKSTTST